MKTILFVSLIFFAIAMSVHAELTPQDLDKIRLIIKEEIKEEIAPMKADIETLKISVARLERHAVGIEEGMNSIEKRIAFSTNVIYGLIAIIAVALVIPAWREQREYQERKRKIEALTREIEALKQQPIVSP